MLVVLAVSVRAAEHPEGGKGAMAYNASGRPWAFTWSRGGQGVGIQGGAPWKITEKGPRTSDKIPLM